MKASLLMLFATLTLAGCGGEEFQDIKDFVRDSGADMRGKVPPPPEVKPYEPFSYDNATGIPDPFKPHKSEVKNANHSGQNQPNLDRPKEELEEFPLETLKMVGYLQQTNVGYGVLRSADGKLHRIKAGNYIGTNFGQVISVSDSEIKIKEMVQDSAGDWSERESSLQLVQ
jgi:type IV pilus assembly protein PilP